VHVDHPLSHLDVQKAMSALQQGFVRQLLEEEEGRSNTLYPDSKGYLTIGVGHLLDPKKGGRLPDTLIDQLLDLDIAEARYGAESLPGFAQLNDVRQAVIISMVFQLGLRHVQYFPAMLGALSRGDYLRAATEMRDSKWWREDSPRRAERAARMMETGEWVART
jgi:lysozyme